MRKVIPMKKRIEETDYCSGCRKPIEYCETYTEIKMKFDSYVKHIALCKECYSHAVLQGVRFN